MCGVGPGRVLFVDGRDGGHWGWASREARGGRSGCWLLCRWARAGAWRAHARGRSRERTKTRFALVRKPEPAMAFLCQCQAPSPLRLCLHHYSLRISGRLGPLPFPGPANPSKHVTFLPGHLSAQIISHANPPSHTGYLRRASLTALHIHQPHAPHHPRRPTRCRTARTRTQTRLDTEAVLRNPRRYRQRGG